MLLPNRVPSPSGNLEICLPVSMALAAGSIAPRGIGAVRCGSLSRLLSHPGVIVRLWKSTAQLRSFAAVVLLSSSSCATLCDNSGSLGFAGIPFAGSRTSFFCSCTSISCSRVGSGWSPSGPVSAPPRQDERESRSARSVRPKSCGRIYVRVTSLPYSSPHRVLSLDVLEKNESTVWGGLRRGCTLDRAR